MQHNVDWAVNNVENSRAVYPWFDEHLDNSISRSVLNTIRSEFDINRALVDSPNTFIRWDYTWNFLKTS